LRLIAKRAKENRKGREKKNWSYGFIPVSGNPRLITHLLRYSPPNAYGPWYISLPCVARDVAAL
jgi:hypothetical protein